MKAFKITISFFLAIGAIFLVAYLEFLSGVSASIYFVPNLAIGVGIALLLICYVVTVIED